MSAYILYFAVFTVGFCWVMAQLDAANKEFETPPPRRSWVIASWTLFSMIVSGTLMIGAGPWLGDFSKNPPPFAFFVFGIWATAFYIAFSRFGDALVKHTPMWVLILFHSFRLLAELLLWRAFHEGLAPKQMTFEGYNFDVIIAASSLPMASLAFYRPRTVWTWVWNILGMISLLTIMFIAVTSMPVPFRIFMEEPSNIWVTRLPYVMLPGVLVTAAIAGHLIIFRKKWNGL